MSSAASRICRWLRGRFQASPLLWNLAWCGLVFLLLCGIPLQRYWDLFDWTGAYWWWPVLMLAVAMHLWWVGFRRHRNTGIGVYSPWLARAAGAWFFLVFGFVLVHWGADRSLPWCAWTLGVCLLGTYFVVRGTFAYAAAWHRCSDRVVGQVRSDLAGGTFHAETVARLRRRAHLFPRLAAVLDWLLPASAQPALKNLEIQLARWLRVDIRRQWGSLHCLAAVRGYYGETELALLRHVGGERPPDGALDDYLSAGDALAAYLLLDWPKNALPEATRRWWIAEIRREMITLALWFAAQPGGTAQQTDPSRIRRWLGTNGAHPAPASAARDDAWLQQSTLRGNMPADRAEYLALLELVSAAALAGIEGHPPCDDVWETVRRALHLFEAVGGSATPPGRTDLREICATTWLALGAALPDPIRRDVWLSMRAMQGEGPPIVARLPEANGDHPDLPVPLAMQAAGDPAVRCGQVALRQLYQRWHGQIPPEWAQGMEAVAARIEEESKRQWPTAN